MADEFAWWDVLALAVPLIAGVLFFIALTAYVRTRTPRVLLFTAAFGVFFLKGLLIGVEVFLPSETGIYDVIETVLDATILVLFFLGMIKG